MTTLKAMLAVTVTAVFHMGFGQIKADESIKTIRISGRLIDSVGAPIPNVTVRFRNLTVRHHLEDNPVKTNERGQFTFPAPTHILYEVHLIVSEMPPVYKGVGTVEVASGQEMELGDVVLQFSPKHKPLVHALGPVQMLGLGSSATLTAAAPQPPSRTIAAAYTLCSCVSSEFCDHPALHIVQSDGREVEPLEEEEQVGFSSCAISEDDDAVGWLADSDFCCTSYPIHKMLVVYRPGKPLKRFTGDGRAIFEWGFVGGSRRVSVYQDFLHGNPSQHYELRDVETERLIGKWDGEPTPKAPSWVRALQ